MVETVWGDEECISERLAREWGVWEVWGKIKKYISSALKSYVVHILGQSAQLL
ncbi:MAG: hypothetical protein F6K17_02550 [Okeania sp. SIO3C4]|nr:hypothetical protein [Okeania sp. SIO3B3]NER01588.1 hypothetical protein [Okeania sp. SIO3C4]